MFRETSGLTEQKEKDPSVPLSKGTGKASTLVYRPRKGHPMITLDNFGKGLVQEFSWVDQRIDGSEEKRTTVWEPSVHKVYHVDVLPSQILPPVTPTSTYVPISTSKRTSKKRKHPF